jgi:uncharacterized membrane protein YeaQ/YmgE (transglycosylase-associated protein family)
MISPSILVGVLVSTLYGTLFHFWRGGSLSRLVFYIILSWIGFWLGHWTGVSLHNTIGKLGTLQLVSATAGAFLCLIIGYWLSLIRIETR